MVDEAKYPLPFVTADQMREVDRAMVEDYGVLLIQMMESAGGHLARLARWRFLNNAPADQTVLVLAGPGGLVPNVILRKSFVAQGDKRLGLLEQSPVNRDISAERIAGLIPPLDAL